MQKLKPFVKILICSFTVIISVFLETLVLSQATQAENDTLNSFNYSKIETYEGLLQILNGITIWYQIGLNVMKTYYLIMIKNICMDC